jgi:competence protein ComEC
VLLAGDIEAKAESALVESGAALAADILVAPHHGSKTSSTEAFIAAVNPAAVVFAAGYRSRFGHPHRDIVARYRDAGARRFDSARDGAVEFHFTPAGWTVSGFRQDRRRYWWREL